LPPLLIQARRDEMLIDDARRYTNRARAAGSPVRLQTWPGMVHVWQIFDPDLTEARDAFERIAEFLAAAAPAARAIVQPGATQQGAEVIIHLPLQGRALQSGEQLGKIGIERVAAGA